MTIVNVAYIAHYSHMIAKFSQFQETDDQEKDSLQILGRKVYSWRKYRRLTQAELAEITGLQRSQISRIENGKANFRIITLVRIAAGLEVIFTNLLLHDPAELKENNN